MAALKKPSSQGRTGGGLFWGKRLVGGWREEVSDAELERALEILTLLGLDSIHSEEAMLDPDGVSAFARTASLWSGAGEDSP